MRLRRLVFALCVLIVVTAAAFALRDVIVAPFTGASTPTPLPLIVAPGAAVAPATATGAPTGAPTPPPSPVASATVVPATPIPWTPTPGTLHIIIASPTRPPSPSVATVTAMFTPTRVPPSATVAVSPTAAKSAQPAARPALAVASGERMAWAQARGDNKDIWLMNSAGGEATRLTTVDGRNREPAWSPDGRLIAFTSNRDGNNEIYVMPPDGSAQTRLTNNRANDYAAAWSPDGRAIAFVSNRDGNDEIYVMRADGGAQTRLMDSGGFDGQPSWSPDGRLIAFTSSRDRDLNIFVMPAAGGATTRLTSDKNDDRDPAWSPDGKMLAFVSNRSGQFQIHTMKADGSDQRKLTNFAKGAEHPTWGMAIAGVSGPGGLLMAFVAYAADAPAAAAADLYVMRGDGSEQQRLTQNEVQDTDPAWYIQPAPVAMAPSPTLPQASATPARPSGSPITGSPTRVSTPSPATTAVLAEVVVDDSSPQFARGGTARYWKEASIGYGNHMFFTYNSRAADNWGRWTPKLPQPGKFEVFAYIPGQNATTLKATYTIAHAGAQNKQTINQATYENTWVSLGTYAFTAQGNENVTLSDMTGEPQSTKRIGFDAVKFVYRGP